MQCRNCGSHYHHCSSCGSDGYSENGFCKPSCQEIYYDSKAPLSEYLEFYITSQGFSEGTTFSEDEDKFTIVIPKKYPFNNRWVQ